MYIVSQQLQVSYKWFDMLVKNSRSRSRSRIRVRVKVSEGLPQRLNSVRFASAGAVATMGFELDVQV